MREVASLLLLATVVQEPVCEHATRGASRPVDLDAVARAHAQAYKSIERLSYDPSVVIPSVEFDSGLPRCRARATRRVRIPPLPPEVKPLWFAPAEDPAPPGSIHVATRARSIAEVAIPADPLLAARFGVRCAPTLVRPVTAEEVELVEGD